jgi:NAD(P)-dependent dehydrogenase (short-subunit alcohol dehydrogenase family)
MPAESATGRRTALVTGASQGVGAAVAVALARHGFDVAPASTHPGRLAGIVTAIEAAGGRAAPVMLDVRSHDGIKQAIAEVIRSLGRIDVLVNNAGVPLRRMALDVTPEDWDTVISTNLTGTFFLTQQVGRHLIEDRRPGCIVSIGSTHGLLGRAERSTYGISKAGVSHMTKMLAIEWAQYGIRVNTVAPGRVDSGSPARAAMSADPEYLESARGRVPLGRFCSVEEVAQAVCYLVSPEAAYITGQTLVLDGGLSAR